MATYPGNVILRGENEVKNITNYGRHVQLRLWQTIFYTCYSIVPNILVSQI